MNTNDVLMEKTPHVSIVVVSYNAADTIKETLDSIYHQSYHNIELVISDDCSKDNTIDVCKDWISTHQERFVRVVLLTAEKNQGIVRNFNRACRASLGDWIKIIAADDKLFPNCIEDYVNYCKQNPEAELVTSIQKVYDNTFAEENCVDSNYVWKDLSIFDKDAREQLTLMAYRVFVSAPTIFIKKSLFIRLGGFDEQFSYEDHPFYIKALESGHKIYFLNKVTVGYRVHDSIFNSNQKLFNYNFIKQAKKFRWERCFQYYNWRQKLAVRLYFFLMHIMNSYGLNKKTPFISKLYKKVVGIIFRFGD